MTTTTNYTKRLDVNCPAGFKFQRGRTTYELEKWCDGVPFFTVAGVVKEAHSAALENDAQEAWEARAR